MALQKFRPEIWSAALLVALRKTFVYGCFTNRDYEGEIAGAGDTVRITSIGRPTISNYVPGPGGTTINPEAVTDFQRTLVVDQAKYFAFEVDDIDARQAAGNVIPQAMSEAAYGLADVVDQFLASKYADVQAANQLGAVSVAIATPTQAYDNVLVPLRIALDKANVPTQGRSVVVGPDFYGVLLRDSRFIKVNESGNDQGLRNGQVGRAAGFDIQVSNNAPNPTGSQFAVLAGTSQAITFAEQLNKVEAYRPQSSFADAVKGLALYGAKTVRPDSLASALVTVS